VLYSEEFLPGLDLWKILKTATLRPDEAEAKLLMKCLLLCITEIWEMKVVHRDIKPSNVIKLNEPERPFVLLDLGIAFSVADTGLTYNADMRDPPSTFRYLAPEMADPNFRDNLDFRADLYTTALTVYEYASGHHPIAEDNDDPIRTVTRAIRQQPTPLATHRPEYSPQFTHLIDQLLKKKPALRPANLKRLIQMMEA
jgi:serine/threonine protein kinase